MRPSRLSSRLVQLAAALSLGLQAFPSAAAVDKPAPKPLAKAASSAAGGSPAALVAAPAEDPMERLRQRLSERLAGPRADSSSGTLDLQVNTRAPAAHAAHAAPGANPTHAPVAPAAARKPALALHAVAAPVALPAGHGTPLRRAAAAHGAAAGQAHWGYEGHAGPATWGGLRPDFNACTNGQRQSPIDIRGGLAVDLDPVKFDYRASPFAVIDNGHTVQVNLPAGNAIEVGARRYELVQFHFHRPSEERIDGRQFEMSLHLVHKDASGRLAVVAVLLGKGPAHPAVQAVWNNLPLEKNEELPARAQLDPAHLLPGDKRYFTYMGSLTTPPCSEGVLWVVMRTPVTLADEQLELFARIYPMNARPVQPVAGRRIMQSQ